MATRTRDLASGSRASSQFVWISPFKVREVTALIKGRHIDDARRILAFTPKRASRYVSKVLESAVANAEHNHQIPQEELVVFSAWADEGPTFKRAQARARGSRYVIRKRTSHIHIVVERTVVPVASPARRAAQAPASEPAAVDEEKPRRRTRAKGKAKAEPKKAEAKQRRTASAATSSRKRPASKGEAPKAKSKARAKASPTKKTGRQKRGAK